VNIHPLHRKLLRDLRHAGPQLAALGVLVACGVASLVSMRAMHAHLSTSQRSYYEVARFGDVWARVREAPRSAVAALAAIPGVVGVEARVVGEAIGETRTAGGTTKVIALRFVGLPLPGRPSVNDLHLRRGRWPVRGGREALVSEGYADATQARLGDTLTAILHGRRERFTIVGVALSPEYIYEMPPGGMFPDPSRFAVLWVDDALLRAAWGVGEGFTDVVLRLSPGTSAREVIPMVDALLAPYGGSGATDRDAQPSHKFVSDEIAQNRAGASIVPTVFLGIAAFLTHVVLSRLVVVQRDQAAVLKAFGYSDRAVGGHYLAFALVPVLAGGVVGVYAGERLAVLFAEIYAQFYRFPAVAYAPRPGPAVLAIGVTVLAGALGALSAVRRMVRLAPAEAMRPEAPPGFRGGPIERRFLTAVPVPWRIPLRQLERRPIRTFASVLGLALAIGAVVVARYASDALTAIDALVFEQAQRQDLDVVFTQLRGEDALLALRGRPGVERVEGYRVAIARLAGPRGDRRVTLIGLDPAGSLHRVVAFDGSVAAVPPRGVLLSDKLARLLGVGPGGSVHVAVLEGRRTTGDLPVVATVDDPLGLAAYMDRLALAQLLDEGGWSTGAWITMAPGAGPEMVAPLVELPAVAAVTFRSDARAGFAATVATSLEIMTLVLGGFAVLIAFGLAYNGARVALSERARELASLRVLGFGRGRVAVLFLAEQGLLLLLALPVGAVVGAWLVRLTVRAADTELFRLPYVLRPASMLVGMLVVTIAVAVSCVLVWRRLDRMDLVDVLKSRE
jgi:putative ABC transport system permease protein